MLKKIMITGATVAVVAGLAPVTPAHADPRDDKDGKGFHITCVGPVFGDRKDEVDVGEITSDEGRPIKNIIRRRDTVEYSYECANAPISNIGNNPGRPGRDRTERYNSGCSGCS